MVQVIQLEWIFIQRVTTNMGDVFAVVEKIIWETFLPCIFFGNRNSLSPIMGDLSTMCNRLDKLVPFGGVCSIVLASEGVWDVWYHR